MSFGHEKMLWLMAALVPLLAWFLWWTWWKRLAIIHQFVQNRFLEQFAIGGVIGFQKLRRVLLLLAVIFLLLALARPQWGFTWEEATQRGRDIIVAIDTSKSMLAEDIQPNRLERAKLAALDLLQIAKYDRLGLVAFAGTAFLQCPLTLDDEAYRQSVQILQPGIIPQGGTALNEAIQAARAAFNEDEAENHKVLILFTDGEDHEENVMELVQKVAGEGMRIFTVGVGTPAGELLRVRDENGNLGYLKDENGNVVKSRLNEQLLQQIATAANGFYLPLRGANAMEVLYQKGLAPLPTSERSSKLMKRLKEQFYWPLSAAIILLVLEIFLPERKAPKREESPNIVPAGGPAVAAAAILILFLTPGVLASPAKALKNYKSGEYKSAYYEYKRLLEKDPADPRLQYNAGASAYQSRKFDEAAKSFQAAVAAKDPNLQQQAYYNLGNSEFRLGEDESNPQQKIAQWEQAVQHYDAALKINANDKDALFNKEIVRKKLEELKKQQQQQQKQQNKDKNENNKDQNQNQKDQQKNNEQQDKEKKDQQQQQQEKQDNNSGNQKQDKQNQQQQEQKDQDKQQQQQAADQQQKDKDKSEQAQSKSGEEKQSEQGQNPEEAQAAQYAQLGKMTPADAKQLLDAQKGEEKAMIFIPPQKKSSQQNRAFKDW